MILFIVSNISGFHTQRCYIWNKKQCQITKICHFAVHCTSSSLHDCQQFGHSCSKAHGPSFFPSNVLNFLKNFHFFFLTFESVCNCQIINTLSAIFNEICCFLGLIYLLIIDCYLVPVTNDIRLNRIILQFEYLIGLS